jgi:hypothetical protein
MNISAADIGLTVNTVNAYGGIAALQQVTDWARTAYNTGIRSNIIIS